MLVELIKPYEYDWDNIEEYSINIRLIEDKIIGNYYVIDTHDMEELLEELKYLQEYYRERRLEALDW